MKSRIVCHRPIYFEHLFFSNGIGKILTRLDTHTSPQYMSHTMLLSEDSSFVTLTIQS